MYESIKNFAQLELSSSTCNYIFFVLTHFLVAIKRSAFFIHSSFTGLAMTFLTSTFPTLTEFSDALGMPTTSFPCN